jgi:hypothetical protein
LAWRSAGLAEAIVAPYLPFFIEWDNASAHPGASPCQHPAGWVRLEGLDLSGHGSRLADWLDGAALPVSISDGTAAVRRVRLVSDGGQIAFG